MSNKKQKKQYRKPTIKALGAGSLPKDRKRDLEALSAMLSEFLDCYIILGFTPAGDAVQMVCAHNAEEYNSISHHLGDFADNFLNPPREHED